MRECQIGNPLRLIIGAWRELNSLSRLAWMERANAAAGQVLVKPWRAGRQSEKSNWCGQTVGGSQGSPGSRRRLIRQRRRRRWRPLPNRSSWKSAAIIHTRADANVGRAGGRSRLVGRNVACSGHNYRPIVAHAPAACRWVPARRLGRELRDSIISLGPIVVTREVPLEEPSKWVKWALNDH